MRKARLASLILCLLAAPAAADATRRTVALVVAVELAPTINTLPLEFYHAVQQAVTSQDLWTLAPVSQVVKSLDRPRSLRSMGALPAFDRGLLTPRLRALNMERRRRGPVRTQQMIRPLQVLTDTLAISGAIIVDCDTVGTRKVRQCGVYFYDRDQRRIIAAAAKEFAVPVADPLRWAGPLAMKLKEGMRAAVEAKDRAEFEKMLDDKSDDEHHYRFLARALGGEAVLASKSSGMTRLPTFGLGIGVLKDSSGLLLEVEGGRAKGVLGQLPAASLESRSLALVVTMQSKALETLLWHFDAGAGYAVRQIKQDGHKLEEAGLLLVLRLGLMFEVIDGFATGFHGRFGRHFQRSQSSAGRLEGEELTSDAAGAGLAIQLRL